MKGRWVLVFVCAMCLGLGRASGQENGLVVVTWPPLLSDETRGVLSFNIDGGNPFDSIRCTLDGGYPEDCSSGEIVYSDLANGLHRIEIETLDLSGETVDAYNFDWAVERLRDPDLSPSEQELADRPAPDIGTDPGHAYYVYDVDDDDSCEEVQQVPVRLDGTIACPAEGCPVLRACVYPLGEHLKATFKYFPVYPATGDDPANSLVLDWARSDLPQDALAESYDIRRTSAEVGAYRQFEWISDSDGNVSGIKSYGSLDLSQTLDLSKAELSGFIKALLRESPMALRPKPPNSAEYRSCRKDWESMFFWCQSNPYTPGDYPYPGSLRDCTREADYATRFCPRPHFRCGKYVVKGLHDCIRCRYDVDPRTPGYDPKKNRLIETTYPEDCPKCPTGVVGTNLLTGETIRSIDLKPMPSPYDAQLRCLSCLGHFPVGNKNWPLTVTDLRSWRYRCCSDPLTQGPFCEVYK